MRLRLCAVAVWVGSAMLTCGIGSFAVASAQAAQPAPAWQIIQASVPTNLIPGTSASSTDATPRYEVLVMNVGGEEAAGTTLTAQLPVGLTASATPDFRYNPTYTNGTPFPHNESGDCEIKPDGAVSCTIATPILGGSSFLVTIPLSVSNSAPAEVTSEVVVEGGGAVGTSHVSTRVDSVPPPFLALESPVTSAGAFDSDGSVAAAGSHPYIERFNVGVSTLRKGGAIFPSELLRRIAFELPQGLVVNPMATEVRCPMKLLNTGEVNPSRTCPQASQVGTLRVTTPVNRHLSVSLYNVVPPPGVPAALGFEFAGLPIVINGGLAGNFHLTAGSTELLKYTNFRITEINAVLWGDPSDSSHDPERNGGESLNPEGCFEIGGCPIAQSPRPFLTMPTSCTEPLEATATLDSWLGNESTRTVPLTDRDFNPAQITGCNQLAFEPTIDSQATTNAAETSAGLDFSIHQPQDESLEGRATAALKDVTATLPEGMSLNPSAANGLESCTETQMGYAPEEGKIRFATTPQSCPDAAKVGNLEVTTPLLEDKLPGAVYVAKPFDNPFGSLLAIYLAVEDEKTGIVAKLAGKVTPDPATGRLTARFTENPELPIEDIDLHFFSGARGVLTTPLTCGTKTTTSTLTPWSTPEGADAHPSSSFATSVGCSASEADAPKTVSFSAGTQTPLSGAYSPLVLRFARPDGSQHITGIDTRLPQGLLGKAAGIPYCPESGIAQAISREHPEQGRAEQSSPSCPAASEVGTVQVTAGSGIAPIPVTGHAYWAGPYKGAPLSLAVIVPAVAGPFDLGTVVNRVALHTGEYDARIHAVSDPLPTIREGIPLDVRSIEVKLERPDFTLNPTSCEAMAIEGSVNTQAGQSAPLNNRFQVGECGRLKFKPKFSLSLKGRTTRSGHPALKAVLKMPSGGANVARAQVGLPHSEFLDQGNLNQVCTQANLKAGTCPESTIYGHAKAWSPLLDQPLEGPVYLGVGFGYTLPALVADLNGQIRILVKGRIDTTKKNGLRTTIESAPDAPVSKFVLEMKGGPKYGLLQNSEDICKKPQRAAVQFNAYNGKVVNLNPLIGNSCGNKKTKKGKGGKSGKG